MTAAWALLAVAVAGCDPIWSAAVRVRDPANLPVTGATVAVACPAASGFERAGMARRTDGSGAATVAGLGPLFPPGCDVYVAAAGYRTRRIRYRDLCPDGPRHCERIFGFELVLVPTP